MGTVRVRAVPGQVPATRDRTRTPSLKRSNIQIPIPGLTVIKILTQTLRVRHCAFSV